MAADAPRPIRIGCGAGFAGDRIDEARDLAERGALDYLFFECLAERTLALAQLRRRADPQAGFDPLLVDRFRAVLPACRVSGTRIVTNMGAANPPAAAKAVIALARAEGMEGLRVAVVTGDDVLDRLPVGARAMETRSPLGQSIPSPISANAYLGAGPILEALTQRADVVITGRVADPSLALGPLMHAFGWGHDDLDLLAAGTLVGHLLECGTQITGGYFADPGVKDVPGLAWLGYPFAEVLPDGTATIGKLEGTGGLIDRATVVEQLLYEVHDPAAYVTPDVCADFSGVAVEQTGLDRVRVRGARGTARPDQLKVTVGGDGGFLAEAEISYAGAGATGRARLAGEVVQARMARRGTKPERLRLDLIGASSLFATAGVVSRTSQDVRLRAALRTADRAEAEALLHEVQALWIAGPAGGAGYRGSVTPSVETCSVLIDRSRVHPRVRMLIA